MEEKNKTIVNMKGELVEVKEIPNSKFSFFTIAKFTLVLLTPVLIYFIFLLYYFLKNCC